MPYTELLTRALHIAWRNRWLWLLALLAGETGGGLSTGGGGNVRFPTSGASQPSGSGAPDFSPALRWVQDHSALLALGAVVFVILWVLFFLLSCAAVAAEIRGVQEIDDQQPMGLGRAWSLGLERFGLVLRLRLWLLALGVAAAVAIGLVVLASVLLAIEQSWGTLALLVYFGLSLGAVLFVIALVLSVVVPLALRAAVVDRLPGRRALVRGVALFSTRAGRVLACWGLMLGCQLVFGIAVTVVAVAVGLVAVGVIYPLYVAGQLAAAIAVGVGFGLVVLVVLGTASAAYAAFYSTFWTLAYRRLEAA